MRDFFEELKTTDDIAGFLVDHKRETVKLGVVIVGIMTALLLFLYRGGDEVDIRDTATPLGNEEGIDEKGGVGQVGSGQTDGAAGVSDAAVTVGNSDVYVDIGGAVKEPKLAKLPSGSRVEDAINEAGGLAPKADISQINRAEQLVDGQKIYIPQKGEIVGGAGVSGEGTSGSDPVSGSAGAAVGAGGKININTADLTQLQTITGIGPVTAQKIIDHRTQNGRFSTIEDIKNVSGIGDKTFENMKEQITV